MPADLAHRRFTISSDIYRAGMETRNLATRYGLPALEWVAIRRELDAGAIEASGKPGRTPAG